MFLIRKYSDCWAIHDDDTGASRPLSSEEVEIVKKAFPGLVDDKVRTVFTDTITGISLTMPTDRA
jgi:hypothetical protein